MDLARARPLVERYLRERRAGSVEAQLAKVTGQLDAIYWEEVEAAVLAAAKEHPDRLVFDKEVRLLIDFGLLDWRFLEGGEKNRATLLRELYAPSAPNQLYLSEWLAQRYRSFVLMSRISRAEPGVVREARARLYGAMKPLFESLPGFPAQAIELFLSGRLDDGIEGLARREDERSADQRKQLAAIRNQMIARARERARTDEELALFDALAKLGHEPSAAPRGPEPRVDDERERVDFLRGEIKLVRSLLRLGVPGSGLAKIHSVLVSLQPRLSKAQLAPLLDRLREGDAGLPASPSIVIAPYVGTGFYEWDRDTIFVPLRSTRSPEDSVVAALATFRMMLDKLQDQGRLARSYKSLVNKDDLHDSFGRDYRSWVLGVGKGFRGGLSPEVFAFFRERIGPGEAHLFAPKEWVTLTPEERLRTIAECRGRVNRAEAGFEDRFRLAIAYHREERRKEALDQVNEAVRLNPVDGRALLARAWLLSQLAAGEQAKETYREILDLCPNTVWSVYATDELARLE